MPAPLSDELRAAILADIRAGELSRNAIARTHGVGQGTVTLIARAAGESFDRAARKTRSATLASTNDLRDRRARLAERLAAEAELLIDSLHKPHVAFNFGGKDNTYAEHEMAEPDVKAKQTILTAAAIALDKSVMLTRFDAGAEAGEAGSLLATLGAALTAQYGDGSAHRTPAEVTE